MTVVSSGVSDSLADLITSIAAGDSQMVVLVLAVSTAVLTNLVTKAAAASILTPIAIGLASSLDLDPVSLLALIGTCISMTFINPFAHQTNLLVVKPGGYTYAQFVRFGVPLIVVSVAAATAVGMLLV